MDETKDQKDEKPALAQSGRADPKWQEKVRASLRAREAGRSIRDGKPKSFRRAVGRTG